MAKSLSINEAAQALGLSARRVRALAEAGRLPAERVGASYVVPSSALSQYRRSRPRAGRPISAANVWALLALLDREDPAWIGASAKWRLRRLIDAGHAAVIDAVGRSEPRAEIHHWRVLRSDLPKLDAESLVVSGLAARHPLLDVPVLRDDPLEAYVSERILLALRRRFKPSEHSADANILLKIPSQPWVLQRGSVAPSSVVAADLLEHADSRVARAGARIIEDLVNASRDS